MAFDQTIVLTDYYRYFLLPGHDTVFLSRIVQIVAHFRSPQYLWTTFYSPQRHCCDLSPGARWGRLYRYEQLPLVSHSTHFPFIPHISAIKDEQDIWELCVLGGQRGKVLNPQRWL